MGDTGLLLCMGYTCLCGEKVTVFRIQTNRAVRNCISDKTVACKHGHVRVVTVEQLRTLDHWLEAYADQNEKDHTAHDGAVRKGKIKAVFVAGENRWQR